MKSWLAISGLVLSLSACGSDANAPTRLVKIDLVTNKPTRILDFPGVTLLNLLAPWKP